MRFQSTHPVRGATPWTTLPAPLPPYFNPRTPCGVRRFSPPVTAYRNQSFQSTHPVRGATDAIPHICFIPLFQSTHPVRGATQSIPLLDVSNRDFNPRTPCGVRHGLRPQVLPHGPISIHAPRAGCDVHLFPHWRPGGGFQSTHPVRGATANIAKAISVIL